LEAVQANGGAHLVLAYQGPIGPLAIRDPAHPQNISELIPVRLDWPNPTVLPSFLRPDPIRRATRKAGSAAARRIPDTRGPSQRPNATRLAACRDLCRLPIVYRTSQAQEHGERAADLPYLPEANPFVESACVVVGLHAEAERGQVGFAGGGNQRVEQAGANSSSPPLPYDAHGHLRGGDIDEAVAGIAGGEQPQPCGADRVPYLSDHEVSGARPTRDVVRELRLARDVINRPMGTVGPPEGRFYQHLGEKGGICGNGGTKDDVHPRNIARSPVRKRILYQLLTVMRCDTLRYVVHGLWWREQDAEYIRRRSVRYPGAIGIEPEWTVEAAADPRRIVRDPDPKSRSSAIRVIGYSPGADFVITVIATRSDHAGVTAWKTTGTDLREYEGQSRP